MRHEWEGLDLIGTGSRELLWLVLAILPFYLATVVATEDSASEPSEQPTQDADLEEIETEGQELATKFGRPPYVPSDVFQDTLRSGGNGPQMVVIPAGSFRMGCLSHFRQCGIDERPIREVRIGRQIAVAKFETTFDEFDRFTAPRGLVPDQTWGRGLRPVIHVAWEDAKRYAKWLSRETGARYRLLTEGEWEFAARGGSEEKYSWGNEIGEGLANCLGCGTEWDGQRTSPVGSFPPNAFGLYDMHGNVMEWVEDCWSSHYRQAPRDGSALVQKDCKTRVLRGGSWDDKPWFLRSALRFRFETSEISNRFIGIRVARELSDWETLER